jgi:hypothetical protein
LSLSLAISSSVKPTLLDELSLDELSLDELSLDELSLDELSLDELSLDELSLDELSLDELSLDKLSLDELSLDESFTSEEEKLLSSLEDSSIEEDIAPTTPHAPIITENTTKKNIIKNLLIWVIMPS